MDIPSMQNQIINGETNGKMEEDPSVLSDKIGVESKNNNYDSTYFTIGTGLSLIFVQVRYSIYCRKEDY